MTCDFFRCLKCSGLDLACDTSPWICRQCGAQYAVEQGIPILVCDWRRHEEELARARAVKPEWYLQEQPPEQSSPWQHHLKKRRSFVEDAIRQYLADKNVQRANTLLDLGCGDGNHLEYLAKYADNLFGSDYNLTRLVRAGFRHPSARLFLADVLDYPVRDNYFDIVFFNHVLEHIRDDARALATVFRILKPRGLLVLGVPNEGAWWWQLAYKLQPETRAKTDHVHFYTADVVTAKLRQQGFSILRVKHLGWGPPHWGWDGRVRKYKWVDDGFELLGRHLIPKQASSLYILAVRNG